MTPPASRLDDGRVRCQGKALRTLRELKTDQYGIRTFVEVGGVPIKFEIVREARIELRGAPPATTLEDGATLPGCARSAVVVRGLLRTERSRR